MAEVARRWRWLGHPAFLAAVALLAINDHVLKDRYATWWTGKLSDVAGVVVVAVLASVLVGVRPATAGTAVGFAALKVAPGVAELASPVLGGVTRRDPTDLVALLALVPTALLLQRAERRQRPTPRHLQPSGPSSAGPGRRGRAAAMLPLLGATLAMFATTATSCGPRPAVERLVVEGGAVYAQVSQGFSTPAWARSTDGTTWEEVDEAPASYREVERPSDPYAEAPSGPAEACGPDGTCFRVVDQRTIEATSSDGERVRELHITDEQFAEISTGCAGPQRGVLTSIAEPADGRPAIASYGAHGVVVRQDDGSWEQTDVLDAHPPEPPLGRGFALLALVSLASAPLLALGTVLFARKRWPQWGLGTAIAVSGWLASGVVAGAVAFFGERDELVPASVAMALGCALTCVVSVVVSRSPRRATALPPPPPLPAPPASGWWSQSPDDDQPPPSQGPTIS